MKLSRRLPAKTTIVLIAVALLLYQLTSLTLNDSDRSSVSSLLTETDAPAGFSYAQTTREFSFPRDHYQHPAFRSEWWYFTGNLYDGNNRNYGFDVTIFRFGLTPTQDKQQASLRTNNIFLAHFAIADVQAEKYLKAEKYSRQLPGITEVTKQPVRIQVENWFIEQRSSQPEKWHIDATTNQFGLSLELSGIRPIALQGENGLSKKSAAPGNASYYYSIPKLAVNGTIKIGEKTSEVTGHAWFDREWSTSALESGQVGWDWFGLHLDQDTELMYYQIRHANGTRDTQSHGSLFTDRGRNRIALGNEIMLQPIKYWRSTKTNARYPVVWRLQSAQHELDLLIEAKFNDQQWDNAFVYWEGAVSVTGLFKSKSINGEGFLEMTGYDRAN